MESNIGSGGRHVTVRGVTFDGDHPVVIVPVMANTVPGIIEEMRHAVAAGADAVEWRVDQLAGAASASECVAALAQVRQAAGDLPLIVTVRTAAEGGAWADGVGEYARLVSALVAAGGADVVDVQVAHRDALAVLAAAHSVRVPVVASSHHFSRTPSAGELADLFEAMADLGADILKIAVMPQHPGDVATLLSATWAARQRYPQPIITMAMGHLGVVSRIAGGVFGSAATFAAVGAVSAPGQLPIDQVRTALGILGE